MLFVVPFGRQIVRYIAQSDRDPSVCRSGTDMAMSGRYAPPWTLFAQSPPPCPEPPCPEPRYPELRYPELRYPELRYPGGGAPGSARSP
jgi:hypothetical protein